MPSDSDRLLIQQIRQKNPRGWEQLIQRYEGRLRAFVQRRIRDRSAIDDIVQETFIGFLNSLPNYDENRELQSYLFTIASYKLTDHLRRESRRGPTGTEAPDVRLSEEIDELQRRASSLARSREKREIEETALGRALGQMIDQWFQKGEYVRVQVLELLFVKGWANQNVASFLKIPDQQVANYRFAAVRKLSEAMKAAGLPTEVFPELMEE